MRVLLLRGKEAVMYFLFLKHEDGRATVIPVHSGEVIGPGLLSKILRDAELTRDDFLKLFD